MRRTDFDNMRQVHPNTQPARAIHQAKLIAVPAGRDGFQGADLLRLTAGGTLQCRQGRALGDLPQRRAEIPIAGR